MKNKNFQYTDTDNRILSGSKNTAENGNLNQLKNRIYTARIISIQFLKEWTYRLKRIFPLPNKFSFVPNPQSILHFFRMIV